MGWYCWLCKQENNTRDSHCWHCGEGRIFELTISQARAVAHELNRLDGIRVTASQAGLRGLAKWLQMYEKQPCGHERRFIVTGDDRDIDPHGKSDRGKSGWCALCELQGVRASNEALLDKMTISLKEATDAREL